VRCQRCPRLREYCQKVAADKRAAFHDQTYHGKPVPNFGDPEARVLVVGLAPAAHGANRTGRMFTGDRSGDFLFEVLYAAGFANQATAVSKDDGLKLSDLMITAAAHCAPPGNKPLREELENCSVHLRDTFAALGDVRVVVCLGRIGFESFLRFGRSRGWVDTLSRYKFGHGVEHVLPGGLTVLCAFHPSQQNTFTGRLTRSMLLSVFLRAGALVKSGRSNADE
jgi:uracil-DNA glycosylase family 4